MERISFNELPAGFFDAVYKAQHYVDHSGLDHKLLELVRMRVSMINNCAYCIDMHYKLGLHYGETGLRLISVGAWRETPYYSEKEMAVLEFAETLTRLPEEHHTEDLYERLTKFFSKAEIANLTLSITQINVWNRITRAFGSIPGKYQIPEALLREEVPA
jgi:AhpD family alkylhydroperoxidase